MPEDAGNFGLMDRRVVDALLSLRERERYFPGLRSWDRLSSDGCSGGAAGSPRRTATGFPRWII